MSAPPVWFEVPETFLDLDLGPDGSTRVRRSMDLTTSLTGDERLHLAVAGEVLVDSLRRSGAVYAAHVMGQAGGGRPRLSVAQFSVFVEPVRMGGDAALDAIAARLAAPGTGRETGFLDLPAGRALAVVEHRTVRTTMSVVGRYRERAHAVRQVQFVLPSPQRRHFVTFALGTECLQDWETYVAMMGAVAASVSFVAPSQRNASPDDPTRRIGDVLGGPPAGGAR